MQPLVSVLCVCYNHENFVKTALESVYYQDYPNIEILIIDDCSTDESVEIIERFVREILLYASTLKENFIRTVFFQKNEKNIGNCKSFNFLFTKSSGKYIIDFSTDDILLDDRISGQVAIFENLSVEYGVIFSNAMLINEKEEFLDPHFPLEKTGVLEVFSQKTTQKVPSGDIYAHILEKYFVCTPTMIMRKTVLDELGGYDETLSYEDFDFWVRSSRKFLYFYQDKITTLKRILKKSHSTKFYDKTYDKQHNPHLKSTLEVCKKAFLLNISEEEHYFLAKNITYHQRQSLLMEDFSLVFDYQDLLETVISNIKITSKKPKNYAKRLVLFCAKYKIRLHFLYKTYLKIKNTLKKMI